jgi:hypothetical protein
MPATQIVNKMAFWRNFSGEEQGIIERFLGNYPQMVASPPKTKMESNSRNSLPGRWLSPQKPLCACGKIRIEAIPFIVTPINIRITQYLLI